MDIKQKSEQKQYSVQIDIYTCSMTINKKWIEKGSANLIVD